MGPGSRILSWSPSGEEGDPEVVGWSPGHLLPDPVRLHHWGAASPWRTHPPPPLQDHRPTPLPRRRFLRPQEGPLGPGASRVVSRQETEARGADRAARPAPWH